MNRNTNDQKLGQWLGQHFELDLIVCRIYGKRWAFQWSNTDDIENARRIQLTDDLGLIVPATIDDKNVRKIKDKAINHLQHL